MLKPYEYDYHVVTIMVVVGWLDKTLVLFIELLNL